jgi:hypothetical protein
MRQTAAEFSSGPTLNHNTSKPLSPLPPALPRFELPSEGSEGADDPLDVAVTTQRPTLDPARALRVLRPGPRIRPKVDATSEVQVEDILLEVYAEDPLPPTRRSSGPLSTAGAAPLLPAHVSIANAIASAVPPAPAESAAVDALLRASDPAFLPFGGQLGQPPRPPTPPSAWTYPHHQAHGYSPDQESPSVAPVAFPSAHMPVASQVAPPSAYYPEPRVAPAARERGRGRGMAIAIWTIGLLVVGLASGAGVAVGLRNGTFAELRDRAKTLTSRGEPAKAAAAAPAPSPEPPSTQVVAPPAVPAAPAVAATFAQPAPTQAAAPAPTPSISVNALPAQTIASDSTLVTFPPSAQGHRVFFDGRPMAVTPAPMTLRCGRHMIRIGSSGKPRVTDLACGQPVTLR